MKYIQDIEIKNFKSIHHQNIEGCRKINVFVGYPNVGKSNILEAVGLFSYLRLSKEKFNLKDICRVKHFSELFYNQDYKESIRITLNKAIELDLRLNSSGELELNVNSLQTEDINIFGKDIFRVQIASDSIYSPYSDVSESRFTHISPIIKKYDFKSDVLLNQQRTPSLSIPYGNNLLDVLKGNSNLRAEIIEIFEAYQLQLFIDNVDQSIKFIKKLNDGTVVSVPYHQVADTLRRVIFYKAAIETNTSTALLFEEPEAHMFPPYISKFTADVRFNKGNNQFFIATHSPFVINDFMEDLSKDDLAIYAVGYKDGETVIKRLTEKQVDEIYQYGVDLFFNLEDFLENVVS